MDFTREPIVETVITPRDGYKIVVRSSKNHGQEEFVVDALEVVSFGNTCFFRSLERPKVFIVPATEYEILEIREPRLALKAAPIEGVIKTPSSPRQTPREPERREVVLPSKEPVGETDSGAGDQPLEEVESAPFENRPEKRRDRKKNLRRRRSGRDEPSDEPVTDQPKAPELKRPPATVQAAETVQPAASPQKDAPVAPPVSSIIPPPTTLIRDDLKRLRGSEEYKGAFYLKEDELQGAEEGDDDVPVVPLSLRGEDESPRRVEEEMKPSLPEENTYKATPAPLEDEPFWGVRPVRPSVTPPSDQS